MKHEIEEDITLKRFLLGKLSPEEQSEVEERLFLDVEYFQQLQAVEDELVDEYLYEDLSAEEQDRFEKYFLTKSERRKNLRIAKALKRYVSKTAEGSLATPSASEPSTTPTPKGTLVKFPLIRRPALQLALAAAALLIAVGIGIILYNARTKNELSSPQASQEQSQPSPSPSTQSAQDQSAAQQDLQIVNKGSEEEDSPPSNKQATDNRVPKSLPPASRAPAPVYVSLLLPTGTVRGEGKVKELKNLPSKGIAHLQLALITETEYQHYQAMLQTEGDKTIRSWNGLKATTGEAGKIVSVRIPVKLLRQQTYRLLLKGVASDSTVTEISAYRFQVIK